MAKINAINNFTQDLTIDPGASGDSFVQFDINSTGEFRIGVYDTDDSFRISQGSALGTTDTFVMTAAGERTLPLNPAFLARPTANVVNATGDGTAYTAVFGTEVFDQNDDFASNTFTAPVDGKYRLAFGALLLLVGAAHTDGIYEIVTSNRTYGSVIFDYGAVPSDPGGTDSIGANMSVLADMEASDTATCRITVSNGTKTITYSSAVTRTTFSGYLAC